MMDQLAVEHHTAEQCLIAKAQPQHERWMVPTWTRLVQMEASIASSWNHKQHILQKVAALAVVV
jgi:hypothetical protein